MSWPMWLPLQSVTLFPIFTNGWIVFVFEDEAVVSGRIVQGRYSGADVAAPAA